MRKRLIFNHLLRFKPSHAQVRGALLTVCFCTVALCAPLAAKDADEDRYADTGDGKARLTFKNPDKFVDFRSQVAGRDEGRPSMIAELRRFFNERAEQYLPADQYIEVTFTDIDLAGRELPVRGSGQFQRIIEDFYPPRLWFTYRVLDSAGELVKSGEEALVDFSFLRLTSRAMAHQTSSMPYEKALLDNWWREQFGGRTQ